MQRVNHILALSPEKFTLLMWENLFKDAKREFLCLDTFLDISHFYEDLEGEFILLDLKFVSQKDFFELFNNELKLISRSFKLICFGERALYQKISFLEFPALFFETPVNVENFVNKLDGLIA